MLFMIIGLLKPEAESRLVEFSAEFNEHFAQPALVVAGVLRDGDGRRKGYMGFFHADDIAEAERYLHESPYYRAGLYERCEVLRYDVEVGNLEPNQERWSAAEAARL